ncbi:bifunctional hexulose-6-phosphate synthase/ribonuclease regulator [Methanospirillum lacunae]|uniref:Bifunctional hexulose-6-phosphate synthase/ribonuclease regulator n=1 Tax=Methanospirillum lacunae TaxID=668570 RepID=A0A2V2N514_9EURY|nr:bifunctional hexulose-6-phosphate synthase/ribonuclease regulator [Methanospirillum lacunae]PWR71608.1 bifunctional hexulose-6-phosphate synthase/ribonuclease regulator [Methanospirillum lacunae]
MNPPILQVALDLVETDRALRIAEAAVAGGADWLEAGTPLIKSEGMAAVTALAKAFPGKTIVADMKTADTGAIEVEMAAKAGASVVCVLGSADDEVIAESVRAGAKYGVKIMTDLLNVSDPPARARVLETLGVDIIAVHTGIDQQMTGKNPLDVLTQIIGTVSVQIAIAGGIDAAIASEAVRIGADIVIVGGWIVRASDVTGSAREIRSSLDNPGPGGWQPPDKESEIRKIFSMVSAPHVTDAMHRKGAMHGLFPLCPGTKATGRAVTVQTIGGDWAKPVEAINTAGEGDFLVISNDEVTSVAPWGELATLSAKNRGVTGVVIDGAVRDVDDIRKMNFPLWAKATVPNAGEPKGFGEINAEIRCAGQTVRPGDWIVADESGVVVIPKERAYEVARRALEVKKTEDRIRAEIRDGSTLAEVMNLLRWEKQ